MENFLESYKQIWSVGVKLHKTTEQQIEVMFYISEIAHFKSCNFLEKFFDEDEKCLQILLVIKARNIFFINSHKNYFLITFWVHESSQKPDESEYFLNVLVKYFIFIFKFDNWRDRHDNFICKHFKPYSSTAMIQSISAVPFGFTENQIVF